MKYRKSIKKFIQQKKLQTKNLLKQKTNKNIFVYSSILHKTVVV